MRTLRSIVVTLLPLFIAGASLHAQISTAGRPPIPHFTNGPVIDETNTLNEQQVQALSQKLVTYRDSTSTEIVVLLIPTLNGYAASDYAVEVAQENHIGQAKKNNGALILLALSDHKGFIATGYGLEPTLTDASTSVIYNQILVPALRQGDVYGGLDRATTAMMQVVAGEFHQTAPKSPLRGTRNAPSIGGVFLVIIGFFILLFVLRALLGTGSRRTVVGAGGGGSGCMGGILQGLFWSSIFNSGRGGWGSGGSFGGFGGGGGGGFGGFGGGGSFGGGGAGGDW